MAIYHFTLHAYCSWMPDRPPGYVQDKQVLAPSARMAASYRKRARQPPVQFNRPQLEMMLSAAADICRRRRWKLFAFAAEPSHVHLVIGWRGFIDCMEVRRTLANLLSRFLGQQAHTRGRRWFARKPSRKRVSDRDHLNHLLHTYLPRHTALCWRDDRDPAPPPLSTWL